jgi:5'-3' exonuclease
MNDQIIHYPRLDTMLLVEDTIRNSKKELTRTGLYRTLDGRVMYQTLKVILDYLENSRKITYSDNKIVWIFTNKKLDSVVLKGKEY